MISRVFISPLAVALVLSAAAASISFAKNDSEAFKKITKAPAHLVDESLAIDEGTETSHVADHTADQVDEHDESLGAAAQEASHNAIPEVHTTKNHVSVEPAPGTRTASKVHSPGAKGPASTPAVSKAAVAASPSGQDNKLTTVEADTALRWLTNGNARYTSKHYRADGRSPEDRKRLLAGQHPHTIVLSCADSRVPPEIIFDQMLGEIFTIRVAGEALDSSVIASVEYAVEHLHPKLLVVMGHTQCGAVEAVLKTKEGESAGSEALDKMIADIRPRLKSVPADKISPNLEVESTVNADGVARDLIKRSEIVRKKVEAGELVIKPALYRMDTGKVSFY